jgi:hypothetical protein
MAVDTTYDIIQGYDMIPAFAGMKADSMDDHVETFAAANNIPFGVIVGSADNITVVLPVAGAPAGIALHDPVYANRQLTGFASGTVTITDAYIAQDAVSVLRKGKAWVKADGVCTPGAVAKYNPATGVASDAGSATYPKAVFRSKDYSWMGILPGDPVQRVVLVELHNPLAA